MQNQNISSYFLKKLIKTVADNNLFRYGDKIVLGVSGGVDSLVLLHSIYELRHYFGISFACASFDHSIRENSGEDIKFVESICKKLSIPFYSKSASVKAYAMNLKLNLEEAARILRYRFLIETAYKFEADKIAVAHHLDDFTENFLMRIVKGGGSGAISGIPIKNGMIIRPFINHTKQEIIKFAEKNGIKYIEDSTNFDTAIFRNFMRLNIIPELKKYNKSLSKTIYNTSIILRKDDDYINNRAMELFQNISKINTTKSKISFLKSDLIDVADPILYRILKISAMSLYGAITSVPENFMPENFLKSCGFDKNVTVSLPHFTSFKKLIKGSGSGRASTFINLGNSIVVKKEYDNIYILIDRAEKEKIITFKGFAFNVSFDYSGFNYYLKKEDFNFKGEKSLYLKEIAAEFTIGQIGDSKENVEAKNIKDKIVLNKKSPSLNNNKVFFDIEKIDYPLEIRSFKNGDRLKPLGSPGLKKLKSYFIDKKIPVEIRKIVPIVLFNEKISWIGLDIIGDEIKITEDTRYIGSMELKAAN